MDLVFLYGIWLKIKATRDRIKSGFPGGLVDVPHIKGLRLFGRWVGLTMTFDIEG